MEAGEASDRWEVALVEEAGQWVEAACPEVEVGVLVALAEVHLVVEVYCLMEAWEVI